MRNRLAARPNVIASVLLSVCLFLALISTAALAQDSDKLARGIERDLNRVDMQIVTSPTKAEEKLLELYGQFEDLKSADPGHKSISSLQRKFDTTAKKLSKRLKRPVVLGEGEAAPAKTEAAPAKSEAVEAPKTQAKSEPAKPAAGDGELSGSVKYRLEQLEKELANGEKQVEAGTPERAERNVNNAEKKLNEVLDKVENENHPRIVAAIERFQALKKNVAAAKASIMPRSVQGELEAAESRASQANQLLSAPIEEKSDFEKRQLEKIESEISIADRRLKGAIEVADDLGYDHGKNPRFAEVAKQIAALQTGYGERLSKFEGRQQANESLAASAETDFADLEALDDIADEYVNSNTLTPDDLFRRENNLDAKERLTLFDEFDREHRPKIEAKLAQVREKYGADRYAIDKTVREAGYEGDAGFVYDRLQTKLKKAAEFRLVAARKLGEDALQTVDWIATTAHDFAFQDGEARALDSAEVARGFAAGDTGIEDMLKDIQGQIDKAVAERWHRIDERTWPGHGAGAPENREELAAVAFKWVVDSPDWGSRQGNKEYKDQDPRIPVKVAVTKDWYVTETDQLGQPLQYGLPVLIAVELEREKADNLARAYELTLLGPKRKDPPRSPPFGDAWVGDSYYIRRDKLD